MKRKEMESLGEERLFREDSVKYGEERLKTNFDLIAEMDIEKARSEGFPFENVYRINISGEDSTDFGPVLVKLVHFPKVKYVQFRSDTVEGSLRTADCLRVVKKAFPELETLEIFFGPFKMELLNKEGWMDFMKDITNLVLIWGEHTKNETKPPDSWREFVRCYKNSLPKLQKFHLRFPFGRWDDEFIIPGIRDLLAKSSRLRSVTGYSGIGFPLYVAKQLTEIVFEDRSAHDEDQNPFPTISYFEAKIYH